MYLINRLPKGKYIDKVTTYNQGLEMKFIRVLAVLAYAALVNCLIVSHLM